MQLFIDEFVTKIAEAYPPPGESLPPRYARSQSPQTPPQMADFN
jgi:hypothetical protein